MQTLAYMAYIHEEAPGDFLVRFYDVPEAIAQGDTLDEAQANAADALDAALEGYLERGLAPPTPSAVDPAQAAPGYAIVEVEITPSLALAARALLAHQMKAKAMTRVQLASLMGRDEKTVRRILSGQGASLDMTVQALHAAGVRPALAFPS